MIKSEDLNNNKKEWLTAYHEAGHLVTAHNYNHKRVTDLLLERISIIPRDLKLGFIKQEEIMLSSR